MATFHCTRCGRAIFRASDLVKKVTLWDLTEYRADAYVIRQAIDIDKLTRYDASLHEGWYCCRFILMRMVVDKFGTGDALLVYTDSVVEVADGAAPPRVADDHGQVRLSARDFESVIVNPKAPDELQMVKYGAIWCPPCRLVDSVIAKLKHDGGLPDVRFFEVDVDEEPNLGARHAVQSIPYFEFFYRGRPLRLNSARLPVRDGVFVGGIGREGLVALCEHVLTQARAGKTEIVL